MCEMALAQCEDESVVAAATVRLLSSPSCELDAEELIVCRLKRAWEEGDDRSLTNTLHVMVCALNFHTASLPQPPSSTPAAPEAYMVGAERFARHALPPLWHGP